MKLSSRLQGAVNDFKNVFNNPTGVESMDISAVHKGIIPYFLYRPPFGRPRGVDAVEVRNLARCTYVESVIDTIITECTSMDWEVVPYNDKTRVSESEIQDAEAFFNDPNSNSGEDIKDIMRLALRDILIADSGVITKVFDRGSYENLVSSYNSVDYNTGKAVEYISSGKLKDRGKRNLSELMVYDGFTFTKNPDMHGIMPEHKAYWQYYWSTAAKPIAFNRDEIMYIEQRPQTNTIYGASPVDDLKNTLYALIFGEKTYSDFFRNDSIPPGALTLDGADRQSIKEFRARLDDTLLTKDTKLDVYRRVFSKIPIFGQKVEFTPFIIPPRELEWLSQQQWFIKLVWMHFGVTPSEMGVTDSSNKATELSQNRVFKRKAVNPRLNLFERYFTNEVLGEFAFDKRNLRGRTIYVPKMRFQFTGFDLDEEIEEQKLFESQLRLGQITINEWRSKKNLENVEWGDIPFKGGSQGVLDQAFGSTFENFVGKKVGGLEGKALTTQAGGRVSTPRPVLIPEALDKVNTLEKAELVFQKALEAYLLNSRDEIVSELRDLDERDTLTEVKNVVAYIEKVKNNISKILDTGIIKTITTKLVNTSYNLGIKDVSDKMDIVFTPNTDALEYIKQHTFENVKDMTDELAKDLRAEFERGIMNGEGANDIADRVEKVFNTTRARAEAIARTELNRTFNHANYDAYKQTGLEGEVEWVAHLDDKTSPICKELNGVKRNIGDQFIYNNEGYMMPPAHVNCRSRLVFHPTPKGNISDTEKKYILKWLSDGAGISAVSKRIGRPRQTIYRLKERLQLE